MRRAGERMRRPLPSRSASKGAATVNAQARSTQGAQRGGGEEELALVIASRAERGEAISRCPVSLRAANGGEAIPYCSEREYLHTIGLHLSSPAVRWEKGWGVRV